MEDKTYGGARQISVTLRPRSSSRSRKTNRRRFTPSRNAVVLQDNPKPAHLHSSTNFPLFSSLNLIRSKPPVPSKTGGSKQKTTTGHLPKPQSSAKSQRSPTPVEVDCTKILGLDERIEREGTLSSLSMTSLLDRADTPHSGRETRASSSKTVRGGNSSGYDKGCFPFQSLPDDCKLKVFSFLSSHDKGRAAQVSVFTMLSMLSKNFSSRHYEIFFSFFPESRKRRFMQIVSLGDSLQVMSNPIF